MSNYPAGAEHDSRAPYNQEDEYISTIEDILWELIESIEDYTDPDGQDFTCSTCTHVYNMLQEAREELRKIN